MKTMNYIKIGIASSILSIAAGCTSFLEEDLKSSLAPDNTYTSSLGFEVGATGLYAIALSLIHISKLRSRWSSTR